MIVKVDVTSPVPPFEQIREQIAALAATGMLPPGSRLPSIRQLASDLGLAAGTVARAYRELESEGVVVSRVRHGTTVLPQRHSSRTARTGPLEAAAAEFARTVKVLGSSTEEALTAARLALLGGLHDQVKNSGLEP